MKLANIIESLPIEKAVIILSMVLAVYIVWLISGEEQLHAEL